MPILSTSTSLQITVVPCSQAWLATVGTLGNGAFLARAIGLISGGKPNLVSHRISEVLYMSNWAVVLALPPRCMVAGTYQTPDFTIQENKGYEFWPVMLHMAPRWTRRV